MTTKIHPTAIVEKGAEFGVDVEIGPYSMISAQTKLGDRCIIHSHVVTYGQVSVDAENIFFPFCVVGASPQDLSYKNENTSVKIGKKNIFRESVTIHRGTAKDKALTTIGNQNYLMVGSHVAHDCILGDKNVIANGTALAGHVEVGNSVNIGGQTGVVQKVRIGDFAFIGAGTILRKDLPPFLCAKGFGEVTGPNLVGMKRSGMSEEDIRCACDLYRAVYLRTGTLEVAIREIEERFANNTFAQGFIGFLKSTKVGVSR